MGKPSAMMCTVSDWEELGTVSTFDGGLSREAPHPRPLQRDQTASSIGLGIVQEVTIGLV